MNLHTLLRTAFSQTNVRKPAVIEGSFMTSKPLELLAKDAKNPFFFLVVEYASKKIAFRIPAFDEVQMYRESGDKTVPRKILRLKEIIPEKRQIILDWTPAGDQMSGFEVILTFPLQGDREGSFSLKILNPERFTLWEKQAKKSKGIVLKPYTSL